LSNAFLDSTGKTDVLLGNCEPTGWANPPDAVVVLVVEEEEEERTEVLKRLDWDKESIN